MLPVSTCPICMARLTIHEERCKSCGTYTHRLPSTCTSKEAALFLELNSKWRACADAMASPSGAKQQYKYGICWSSDINKFISVYGVKSSESLQYAIEYVGGDLSKSSAAPLDSFAVSKAKLKFVGHFLAIQKMFSSISDLADWLSVAGYDEMRELMDKNTNNSKISLPTFGDVAIGLFVTLGSLGLGYKTLGLNSNRDDAEETEKSLRIAIEFRFGRRL